jgi:integrase
MKGCPDKAATEAMARKLGSEADLRRRGIIDPRTDAYTNHEARPVADHLADWHAYLIGKGSTQQHADLSRNRVARLIALARARRISDLAPSRIQAALKAVRDDGASLRSVHHYTRAVKGFSKWLWRDGRAREDTLPHLTSPNPDADRRHERRALAPEELARLIQAAETGPVVLKLSGPDRAALYLVALGTGFRANELRSLRPEAVRLGGEPPTITVAAAYSKRRRDDVQPIRPELADALRPWLASKAPGMPVFGNLTKHTNILIQTDLERAGIPYRDDSDRVADFHALRHSYVSALARSNAPVKIVQTLARHSTPTPYPRGLRARRAVRPDERPGRPPRPDRDGPETRGHHPGRDGD